MSILVRYQPSNLTRAQYDKVNEILQAGGGSGPPAELELHVVFGDEGDLRVSEIWASEAAWRAEYDGPLKGALDEAGVQMDAKPDFFEVGGMMGSALAAQ